MAPVDHGRQAQPNWTPNLHHVATMEKGFSIAGIRFVWARADSGFQGCPAVNRIRLLCTILVLLCAGVYWPAVTHPFINYDDPEYVTTNPRVQGGLRLENVLW